MITSVKIGNTNITIEVDKHGNITVVSDGHFQLVMQNMGQPGVNGPELFFDTKQLVEELNKTCLEIAQRGFEDMFSLEVAAK